jgi:NAD-dependent deacetylase
MKMKRKVVVFTGAGISAESGVATFRDNGGLWDEFKVEDVATPKAFKNNTEVFCNFYNMRKNQMKTVLPNQAHHIVKELENEFDVVVVTSNVDDLHEKAGSSKIFHLHGDLTKLRSSYDPSYVIDYVDDLKVGDMCPDGSQMRPDIVLFGENLPTGEFESAMAAIAEADVVIICGTSMRVYPAAGMPWESKETCLIYYIDPNGTEVSVPKQKKPFFTYVNEKATDGMRFVADDIKEIYL